MRSAFSPGKRPGEERQNILHAVQAQAKSAACQASKPILEAFREAEVSVKRERAKGERRRRSGPPGVMAGPCGHGGCLDANPFLRDGPARSDLATGWGLIRDRRVPRGEGPPCPQEVVCHVAMREKEPRWGMDRDQPVLVGRGFGERCRPRQEHWSATVAGRVGWRTLPERIHHVASLTQAAHTHHVTDVPPLRHLDGMGVTIQPSHQTIKREKRQRPRRKRSGNTREILVALGLWPDGRREIRDGQIADREEHREGEVRGQRLWEHGCGPEKGCPVLGRDGRGGGEAFARGDATTVPAPRDRVPHRQNVSTNGRRERQGQENQEQRRHLREQAAAIARADTATQAQARLDRWAAPWREPAPHAVAMLEREGAQTLVFSDLPGLDRTWRRTRWLLERTPRE